MYDQIANDWNLHRNAFIKKFVPTLGETEFDTFYNTQGETLLPVAYFLFLLFLFANSVVFMNLLVGLAVDDIQGVQSKAFLKRVALRTIGITQSFSRKLFSQMKLKAIQYGYGGSLNLTHFNTARLHDQFESAQLSRKEMKDAFKIQ
ncbi:hypothetical protein RF11_12540 [Thelohanellus kitauei]|uniref:Ion transport domain-containing protein n=1 Tax=Thelohanellus kitauei TaxID=669202 RepID=A0A0C2N1R0_THEKT|nr:hypothetical protein RF11_12540 [Thelohanellus kitauei]